MIYNFIIIMITAVGFMNLNKNAYKYPTYREI